MLNTSTVKRVTNVRVLVSGGAGFIGSNLCEDLLKYNNEVVCLDNFLTGHRRNIQDLLCNKRFRLIEGDIRNPEDCHRACDGIDIVLHQAALGSVPRSINTPTITNAINAGGFLNMLMAARDAKVKRFVYASSSSVYGDSSELPMVEERIGKPLSPYAVSKYVNELYAQVFALNFGLELIGLRYFNVFGRRQDSLGPYAAVIPKFTMMLMKHESPVINGDGSNSRDFTYIDNVILINHLAATANDTQAIGQVYNTAAGERTNLNRLVRHLKDNLSKYDPVIGDIESKAGPERKGDILHSLASIEKAKKLLGYQTVYSVEEGLKYAVDWYWENLKNQY